MRFDTLVHNAVLITCNPFFDIIRRGWIGVSGERIEALGVESEDWQRPEALTTIDAHGGIADNILWRVGAASAILSRE